MASGVRLLRENVAVPTAAYSWVALVAPLADWTQPHTVLRANETLRLQVRLARMRAQFWDEDGERALFPAGESDVAPSPHPPASFNLESLTAFIECVTDAMESAEFTEEAQPTLDTLLLVHAQLARNEHPSALVVS